MNNEDCLAVDASRRYAVLADGMGGYNAGEVASRVAVMTIEHEMGKLDEKAGLDRFSAASVEPILVQQVLAANAAICRAAAQHAEYSGMGTTLVLALWHGTSLSVAHAGDSRLYRLRGAALDRLTRDHSVLQEQVDLGLVKPHEARHSPARHLVTRALGFGDDVEVEVHTHAAQLGDLYLLCSDGLTDMLDESDIGAMLTGGRDLHELAGALVKQANSNGGRDNISVILARLRLALA